MNIKPFVIYEIINPHFAKVHLFSNIPTKVGY